MIIFDLDGTLADCNHRKHFIDRHRDQFPKGYVQKQSCSSEYPHSNDPWIHKHTGEKWQPNWEAFFDACDQDIPIIPVFTIFNTIRQYIDVQIWSGRSESVRDKTIHWFLNKCPIRPTYWNEDSWNHVLKMRPIGDTTPDDILKEQWLNQRCSDLISSQIEGKTTSEHDILYVFDDRPKVIRMWRKRGIFVFNCNQSDEEF